MVIFSKPVEIYLHRSHFEVFHPNESVDVPQVIHTVLCYSHLNDTCVVSTVNVSVCVFLDFQTV